MQRTFGKDVLPLDHPATTPVLYTGGDNPRLVQPVDAPTRAILVMNDTPILLNASPTAPITSVAQDGLLLRRTGVTAIFVRVNGTSGTLTFTTYRMTATGIIPAQGIVRVSIRGPAATATSGPVSIAYTTGTGAFLGTALGTDGDGFLDAVSNADGLFLATITFGATANVKTLTLCYGPDQYIVSVDLT